MRTRVDRDDFEEFVAVCSGRLMRTAYLLTGDRADAEELLQGALARAWLDWVRLDAPPEPHTRRSMAVRYVTWWRGRSRHDDSTGVGLGGLSRRQRAVVVLRHLDGLSEQDVGEVFDWPPSAVRAVEAGALARLGTGTAELRARLAAAADGLDQSGVQERLGQVDDRATTGERRRRARRVLTGSLAAVALLVAVVVVPRAVPEAGTGPDQPTPGPVVEAPPVLIGHQLQPVMTVNGVGYEYFRSEESQPGRERLRVAIASDKRPQTVAWTSSRSPTARILVSMDGELVSRGRAGIFETGVVLSAHRTHLIVLRSTDADASTRLGFALYRWPA
jgi:DNA-directed RNA polymerase specialized sigma24 family protein